MKFPVSDLGAIGWVPDVDGVDLPPNAWTDVANVRFRNGYVEPMPGCVEVASGLARTFLPHWLHQYSSNTTSYIVSAGLTAVWVSDPSGTATDITGTAPTGTADDRWTGGVMFGVLGINNGVDSPMYWAGSTGSNLATFTGWSANWKCKAFRPFLNFWIALNITKSGTDYPHMVKWSHTADPGAVPSSWDETDATLDAGESNLPGQDPIVDGLQVGSRFWVLKRRSIHAMDYIGGVQIFRFSRLPGEVGVLARNCAVETPRGVVLLTSSDIVLHNGQSYSSIADGRVRRWVFDNINPARYGRSFVVASHDDQEVHIFIPTGDADYPNVSVIWNWNENTWTRRNLSECPAGATFDADFALDPWDWAEEIGYGGFPTDPVGAYEWDAGTETWDEYDSDLGGTKAQIIVSAKSELIDTDSRLLLLDRGVIDPSYTNSSASYSFQTGYAYRGGIAFGGAEDTRFSWRAIWPRFTGSAITGSYLPNLQAQAVGSAGEAPSNLLSTSSSNAAATKGYAPQRYVPNDLTVDGINVYPRAGRFFEWRLNLESQYSCKLKTVVWELDKLGQF